MTKATENQRVFVEQLFNSVFSNGFVDLFRDEERKSYSILKAVTGDERCPVASGKASIKPYHYLGNRGS